MENAAYELYSSLSANNEVTLVKWGGSNKLLPIVYCGLLARALWSGIRRKPDVIYLQDGMMAPLGWIVKSIVRRPTVMTIHGLEATYQNPLYKLMVTPFIRKQTKLVAVSNETKQKVERGIPGAEPLVIFNGLRDAFYKPGGRGEYLAVIARDTGIPLEKLQQSKIIHTNGRLVRRKGVLWFVDNVMPLLDKSVLYLVSGEGKDEEAILAAIEKHGLQEQVKLLGWVSEKLLHTLYNTADIFLMPNVPVQNDMEGFGLVALEAASCGTLVVASELEGIKDAIINGQNGFLVQAGDANKYIEVVKRELNERSLSPELVRHYTLTHYSWDETARQYQDLMKLVSGKR